MAGHSQFKNIMHRKGRQDKVKSKLFGKLAREITVSAKLGLPDPAMNPRLRARHPGGARGEHAEGQYRPRHQEGARRRCRELRRDPLRGLRPGRRRGHRRGPDRQPQPHRRRGAREPSPSSGGNLAETGAVSFMFDHVGVVEYDARRRQRRRRCWKPRSRPAPRTWCRARAATKSTPRRIRCATSPRRWRRNSASRARRRWCGSRRTRCRSNDEQGEKLFKLIETLNEHDDVQNVYANFEMSDALMQRLSA